MPPVTSLSDYRARRDGFERVNVEATVFPLDAEHFELRLTDEEETYALKVERAWLEHLHAKLGKLLNAREESEP